MDRWNVSQDPKYKKFSVHPCIDICLVEGAIYSNAFVRPGSTLEGQISWVNNLSSWNFMEFLDWIGKSSETWTICPVEMLWKLWTGCERKSSGTWRPRRASVSRTTWANSAKSRKLVSPRAGAGARAPADLPDLPAVFLISLNFWYLSNSGWDWVNSPPTLKSFVQCYSTNILTIFVMKHNQSYIFKSMQITRDRRI